MTDPLEIAIKATKKELKQVDKDHSKVVLKMKKKRDKLQITLDSLLDQKDKLEQEYIREEES